MNSKIQQIKLLIGQGKIENALSLIKEEINDNALLDKILLQESRFSENKERINNGTIDNLNAAIINNQIVKALLEILTILENTKNKDNSSRQSELSLVEESLVSSLVVQFKSTIKFYFFILLVPLAISFTFIFYKLFNSNNIDAFQLLGSALIASISVFPFREIMKRRDTITILFAIISQIKYLKINPTESQIKKVNDFFWEFLNNMIIKK